MLEKVASYLQEQGLAGDGDRVLCMVSGGADSVAMLHLLDKLTRNSLGNPLGDHGNDSHDSASHGSGLQGTGSQGTNSQGTSSQGADSQSADSHGSSSHGATTINTVSLTLGVCHVNYGRRGDASDDDEALVRRLGETLNIPVHVIQAPREQRANFQAWARDFRYLAAENLCHRLGYTRIAVAHNRDDRVETFLYRLITYSGRRSLVVMPPRRGRVIRPLLFATAAAIRDFCATNYLPYHNDESNNSLDYTRNRIRHLVMPPLAEIRPDFQDHIIDTIALLEDEESVLSAISDEAWRVLTGNETDTGIPVLSARELTAQPHAVARLVIRRWLTETDVSISLSHRLLDSIVALGAGQSGTHAITLTADLQVERRYDRLLIVAREAGGKEPDRIAPKDGASKRQEGRATLAAGSVLKTDSLPGAPSEVELGIPGQAVFGDYLIETVNSPPWQFDSPDPLLATFDADQLELPLRIRVWRPGDRFAPLGLGGSKSIQDLFTDEKVPRPERRRVPIVTSAGRIAWVCGLRVAEEFRVTRRTEHTVGLKATRSAVERAI